MAILTGSFVSLAIPTIDQIAVRNGPTIPGYKTQPIVSDTNLQQIPMYVGTNRAINVISGSTGDYTPIPIYRGRFAGNYVMETGYPPVGASDITIIGYV